MASGGKRSWPEVARRVGSRTTGGAEEGGFPALDFPSLGRRVARKPATDAAISLDPSIPILTPAGGRSAAR